MCKFMNEIVQALKSELESVLTDQKVSICLSENELVKSSERDVVRIFALKSSKIKNYPGYSLCKYEIQLYVELNTRNRENIFSALSEILGNIENAIHQMTLNIDSENYLGLRDTSCKHLEYPRIDQSVKNKNTGKVLATFEIFEE